MRSCLKTELSHGDAALPPKDRATEDDALSISHTPRTMKPTLACPPCRDSWSRGWHACSVAKAGDALATTGEST